MSDNFHVKQVFSSLRRFLEEKRSEPSPDERFLVRQVIADTGFDGFLTPDGEYVMSQTDVAKAVGVYENSLRNFLRQKRLEHPSDGRFTLRKTIAETGYEGGQAINAVTLDAAILFWFVQNTKGNKEAQALV